jgi:alkylation response protein AidB-like acyl-CoA dehydrogenase
MPRYTPPARDMQFVLHELLDVGNALSEMPDFAEVDAEIVDRVLDEAGKFCSEVIFPLNASGDAEGCRRDVDGNVTAPAGFRDAYRQYVEAGWPALACSPDFGGQGLPELVNNCLYEMLNSANQAWTMYPGLTHGAYACLAAHGTEEIKQTYLPRIVEGSWTGTMCLTESHCGTDLGLLRTRAEPDADGSYSLSGSKIFISSGEHDLAENIIHLVLARLPDAPAGTKGISLFVVPKFIPDADGNPGARNGIRCGAIEEKMGIHGNATCVINLDGAQGWLVGEPNRGLPAMFVMMNGARLGVGMQSLGLAEVSYQNAVAYARDRLQMRSLSGPKAKDKPADPIIVHPDVRRMLLTQKAYTEAARAFCYWIGLMIDKEHHHPDEAVREDCAELVALLTPVVKAFITDNTFETANMALQCYGGHGYIREWGMEQFVRDARINMIYEGTNGVQALDLIGRKVLGDGGARLKRFGRLVEAFIKANAEREDMKEFVEPLADIGGKLTRLSGEIGAKAMQNPEEAGAASTAYLRVLGHTIYAYLWARMARIALDKQGESFYDAKLATARFYFARLLPETAWHIRAARSGADSVMALDEAQF